MHRAMQQSTGWSGKMSLKLRHVSRARNNIREQAMQRFRGSVPHKREQKVQRPWARCRNDKEAGVAELK